MNLNRFTKLLSVTRLAGILIAGLLLASCASGPGSGNEPLSLPSPFSAVTQDAGWYLDRVSDEHPDEAFVWQILAARSYLASGKTEPAAALLQQLRKQGKSAEQLAQLQLLEAQVVLAKGNTKGALALLEQKPATQLDPDTEKAWYLQRASLQLDNKDRFGAAKSLIALDPFIKDEAQKENHRQIWILLQGMTPATLQSLQEAPAPDVTTGWLQLAALVNQYGAQPDQLPRQLRIWKRSFPQHPALGDMPAGLDKLLATELNEPLQAAVMLPLSGNLAAQGQALQYGILMSYKQSGSQLKVKFYDTQSKPIATLYQQAVQEGADMIIGPLLKDRVQALLDLKPTIPVLALNELDKPVLDEKNFFFSLSAAADAGQAAQYLYQQGYRQPMVLASQDRIGYAGVQNFEKAWQAVSQGRPVVATFGGRQEIEGMVRNALSGKTAGRIQQVSDLTSDTPRHNTFNGIDAAYIIAGPVDTRTIKPYIDFNVSQAKGGLATFIAGRGYDSTAREVLPELNGVHISDMPLMLGSYDGLKAQIQQMWPQLSGDRLRLFAMGYDAFTLTGKLQQLRANPSMQLSGLTGQLSIDGNGVVQRQLSWGIYQNGIVRDPHALPDNTEATSDEATDEPDASGSEQPVASDPAEPGQAL
ncbi:penicillin-binding protein activator [Aeromonas simiae]|uniref:LppC family lipoprotein n=1 Tax=Aeromonas simiae TaxID=218936 RepID=A0A5J6WXN8_9GAMM|nr:penicillin-binding protein activator [Aeromonas simiae]QFI55752.1 LppC family lipoprotein [Aeromonas simiae]